MSEEANTENTGAEQQSDSTDWKARFEAADKRAKTFEGKLADVEKQLEGYDPNKIQKWQAGAVALPPPSAAGALLEVFIT